LCLVDWRNVARDADCATAPPAVVRATQPSPPEYRRSLRGADGSQCAIRHVRRGAIALSVRRRGAGRPAGLLGLRAARLLRARLGGGTDPAPVVVVALASAWQRVRWQSDISRI